MEIKKAGFQPILRISFPDDFDVDEITRGTKIQPCRAVRYSDSGYTKAFHQKKSGIWEYYEPCKFVESFSLAEVLNGFFKPFTEEKVKHIRQITERNGGKITILVNIYFYHLSVPDLVFGENAMRIIHALNADIEMNMNESEEEA